MKTKKRSFFKSLILLILFVPCIFFFSACSNDVPFYEQAGYESLEAMLADLKGADGKDGEDGENGLNGTNGQDAPQETSYDIYLKAKELGEYNGSYIDFVKNVLNLTETNENVLINKNLASVVTIKTSTPNYGSQSGTGVIYSIDFENDLAFVITNYHVAYCSGTLSPYESFKLNMYGNDPSKEFDAYFVGGSKHYDIAILSVTNCDVFEAYNAVPATFNTADATMGSKCFAIGNTIGQGISITSGVISKDSEERILSVGGENPVVRLIRHDAYIAGGNSGGGLFNSRGELVGITNGGLKSTSTGGESNLINFAIPASAVKGVAENIITNCYNTVCKQLKTFNFGFEFESSSSSGHNGDLVSQTDVVYISSIDAEILPETTLSVNDKIVSLTLTDGTTELKQNVSRLHHVNDFLLLANSTHTLKLEVSRTGVAENIIVEFDLSEFGDHIKFVS